MQLKGLVRFFTILLILYSFYELSFTWVVRSHERKMEAKAKQFVDRTMPNADKAAREAALQARYKRLIDSTKDETVHYGFMGAISYDQAKKEELNLGLDLKGGINVTMEVELSGLLRSLSNNSKYHKRNDVGNLTVLNEFEISVLENAAGKRRKVFEMPFLACEPLCYPTAHQDAAE